MKNNGIPVIRYAIIVVRYLLERLKKESYSTMLKSIFNRIEEYIVVGLLAIMSIVLGLQVFFRYVLNMPLSWSEEMARYLFIWITFIGAGYGVKHHYHIEMEALFNCFPESFQKIVLVVTNITCILAYGCIIPDSVRFVANQSKIVSTAMKIPMGFVYVSIPIGCLILIVRLAIDTVEIIRRRDISEIEEGR
ncbi:TRAP transporter small permease [Marispirochaeta sp.]|uniref:TRAP transporter small permease n=1 Tax=Marispirochaeta sp. TaxID=2038653 RepID=UPI0029C7A7DD|nr:TRAP transporter small permease [Marispirochaeta sp.]